MIIALLMLSSCVVENKKNLYEKEEISSESLKKYKKLESNFFDNDISYNKDMTILGKKLFYDNDLSENKSLSCNSCHSLETAGADIYRFSKINTEEFTSRNTPTIFNSAGNKYLSWDGEFTSIEEKVVDSLLSSEEMGIKNKDVILTIISSKEEYRESFKLLFPNSEESISIHNIATAIGSYVRTLATPSKWDLFLAGDYDILSGEEKHGFNLFDDYGCGTCHNGELLGGDKLTKLGMSMPWPTDSDYGRFNLTKDESDKMIFKVPSLRNCTATPPYFHNGSEASLEEAIIMMGYYQLGKSISDEEASAIKSWLGSTAGILSGYGNH